MSPCCSFTCNYVLCINDFWCVYSEVVDKAGVDPLITLLNDAKPLVQANAAVCLTNLATEGILVTLPQTNKPWHGFRAFCPALGIWWFFFARLAFPALGGICILLFPPLELAVCFPAQSARLCSTETCTLRGKTVVYLVAYVCFDWSDVNSYSVVCYCCVVIVNFVVVYFRVLEIGNTTKRRCSRPCTSSTVQVRMNTTGLIL